MAGNINVKSTGIKKTVVRPVDVVEKRRGNSQGARVDARKK